MKKILIISFVLLMAAMQATAQKKNLPPPSISIGAEWMFLAAGAGANASVAIPFSDGFSFAVHSSYDLFYTKYDGKKVINVAGGIRFGDIRDLYVLLSIGYSSISYPSDRYFGKNYHGISFNAAVGFVFLNNIDVSGEINYIIDNNDYLGDYIFAKAKIAYAIPLKKQKK